MEEEDYGEMPILSPQTYGEDFQANEPEQMEESSNAVRFL
jgi:hypothetical protein